MRPTVRIYFDGALAGAIDALTLGDPLKGQLDNATYPLADDFADVSDDVRSVQVRRGRSNETTTVDAGNAVVTLDNRTRLYDPTASASISPYANAILPRKEITVSIGEVPVFSGQVEDWDLQYSMNGDSVTLAKAADGFTLLSQYEVPAGAGFTGLSGSVIYQTASAVGWPMGRVALDGGTASVGAHTVDAGQQALPYLQKITNTEQALLFIGKDGTLTYRDRIASRIDKGTVFADDGSGIPFGNIEITFGTEFLYTQIVVDYPGGSASAVSASANVANYGINTLTLDTYLPDGTSAGDIAGFLAEQYGEPTFRITGVTVDVNALPPSQVAQILDLELGHGARVIFTPNGVGEPIERELAVDSIEHNITPNSHTISLKFFNPFLTRRTGTVTGVSGEAGTVTGAVGYVGDVAGAQGESGTVTGAAGYVGGVTGSNGSSGSVIGVKALLFVLDTSALNGADVLQ